MDKSKSKIKGLFKGVAVGFAFVMCSAFFPVNALAKAVTNYEGTDNATLNTTRLQVGQDSVVTETRVKKGQSVTIPTANYKYNLNGEVKELQILPNSENTVTHEERVITATVKVLYQATNDEVKINPDSTFVADRVGRYVILYTVVDGEETYTYDMIVQSEASDVTFEFPTNISNVIPNVYDRAIAEKRNIVLPLPTIEDEDGEELLTAEDAGYYTTDKNGFNDPAADPTKKKNAFVEIRLASNVQVGTGEEGDAKRNVSIKYNEEKKEFYIDGKDLDYESVEGKTFQIIYSYYTLSSDENPVFISSISKSFTVDNGYYYHTDPEENDNGLDLTPTWSSSYSDITAVVGVERELPKITASTSSENSPASESVDVYYTIQAFMRGNNSKYDIEVTNDNEKIDVELLKKGTFKAKVEGSFRFVYNVKDFYGNTINTSKTSFTIDNVKDTRAANVYAYDGREESYNEKDNTYTSVDTKIKNRSVDRNIIVYAVGGTDNMVARDKLILRREIRDNQTTKKFVIGDNNGEEIYNSYNLIFAPKAESGEDLSSILKQIITDNYELKKQMVLENKDITDPAQITTFLKENKFLLVTTEFNAEIEKDGENAKEIVPGLTKEDPEALEKMMRLNDPDKIGYAYLEPEGSSKKDFTESSITIYYYAGDGINAETRKLYTVNLASGYSDNAGPTLTFSTDLQAAYLPTDKIEFNVATATDTQDTRLDTVTAYRFLDKDKHAVASELTTGKLRYVIGRKANLNEKDVNKWYTTDDGNGLVESDGWYFDTTKTKYTIDLADDRRPATAEYVEILAYTIDDDGNAGFFTKTVKIAKIVDDDMPELFLVEKAPTAGDVYNAPEEIQLPILHFADKGSNYMSAKVTVLKIVEDVEGKKTTTYLQSLNMSTEFDTIRDTFKVNAGYFRASTQGKYQVAVTVTDAANHSVTTYFNYDVKGGAIDDEPIIDNIASGKVDLEPGQQYYLTPPTVSIIKDDNYGYIGLEEDDDAYTATNYTTTVTSANADYTLDQFYFSAAQRGSFTLVYKVYILRYSKENLASSATLNKLYFEDGKLKYKTESGEYFVYIDRESGENGKVVAKEKLTFGGKVLDESGDEYKELMKNLTLWSIESNPIQINVGGVDVEVKIDEDYYKRSFETVGEKLEIIKPNSIEYNGEGYSTNNKESTVTITKTVRGSTTTLASLNFEEWNTKLSEDNANDFEISDENTENKKVVLILKDNGVYHIRYSIQAQDRNQNNVGDAKILEYDISNGDTVDPKLTLGKKLTEEKYKIGDTMTLNLAAITVSDTVTTDTDKLLSTLKVTIQNTTLNEGSTTIPNTADEEGKLKFEYKLEQAGTYTLNISVEDEAGNKTTRTYNFEVTTDEKSSVDVKEVMGGVLIGLSVAILAGVVIYFVVSKVKLDKKEKRYKE